MIQYCTRCDKKLITEVEEIALLKLKRGDPMEFVELRAKRCQCFSLEAVNRVRALENKLKQREAA